MVRLVGPLELPLGGRPYADCAPADLGAGRYGFRRLNPPLRYESDTWCPFFRGRLF